MTNVYIPNQGVLGIYFKSYQGSVYHFRYIPKALSRGCCAHWGAGRSCHGDLMEAGRAQSGPG